MLSTLVLLHGLVSLSSLVVAASPFTCVASDGYPWCVHTPPSYSASSSKKWPTLFFLPGSGARGDLGQASNLAGYDGVGKMIVQKPSGKAATEFITVIPIAPTTERHFFPEKVKIVLDAALAGYKIDEDRIYLSGYSMGSRGTWRNLVATPDVWAAAADSAGSPEQAGAGTLLQQAASAVWPQLNLITKVPIKSFAGYSDTTAGYTGSQAAQAQLEKLGDKVSSLTIYQGATHADMSTKPWEDDSLFTWFLQQSLSGSSTSTTSSSSNSTSSTSSSSSASSSDDDDEDEDCDDDEEDASDDEDEDCDEEEGGDEDEDCDDEDDDEEEATAAAASEDDCDDDEKTATKSTGNKTKSSSAKTKSAKRSAVAPAHNNPHHIPRSVDVIQSNNPHHVPRAAASPRLASRGAAITRSEARMARRRLPSQRDDEVTVEARAAAKEPTIFDAPSGSTIKARHHRAGVGRRGHTSSWGR